MHNTMDNGLRRERYGLETRDFLLLNINIAPNVHTHVMVVYFWCGSYIMLYDRLYTVENCIKS